MMLIEEALVPDTALPLAAFKAHLRLGTGFAEDDVQDAVLTSFLRAALAAVEARISKALVARDFTWTVSRWRLGDREVLPLAPVQAITSVTVQDRFGEAEALSDQSYVLEVDSERPALVAMTGALPSVPRGGKVAIAFTAGYGASWDDIPSDLAQAVFLLAGHYYEYRDETSLARGCMPFGVQSLLERYRPMRLFGGGSV